MPWVTIKNQFSLLLLRYFSTYGQISPINFLCFFLISNYAKHDLCRPSDYAKQTPPYSLNKIQHHQANLEQQIIHNKIEQEFLSYFSSK